MLTVMSLRVLRKTGSAIQKALLYTVMVDETTDCFKKGYIVMVTRRVDGDLNVHKSFIGLYSAPTIDTNTIATILKDLLV